MMIPQRKQDNMNKKPKGDTTQKRRQARRREKLNQIARAKGFSSWSAYETAVLNERVKIAALADEA